MIVHPVVDRFFTHVPLDPAMATVFAAVFIGSVLLTMRRTSYGLALLIATTPFAVYRDLFSTTITLPKIVLLGVAVGLSAHWKSIGRWRESPFFAIFIALAAYAAATALSFVHAIHYAPTLRELLKDAQYALLFAVAYACYRCERDDRLIVAVIALTTIAVGLTALAEEVLGAPSGLCIGSAIVPRIAGVLEGPNQLAAYLGTAIAVLGAWEMRRRSTLAAAAITLGACAAVLTFSRAGLASLAIVAVIWCVYDRRGAAKALTPLLFGVVAGLGVAGLWQLYAHTGGLMRLSLSASTCAGSVGNRAELYRAAWEMWLAHPWFGIGAGNFELELYRVGVLGVRTHANSWYLQSLAEGGVFLFAATVALVVTVLVSFARRLRASSPWMLAAFAATLALTLHQIVDYLVFYPKVAEPWWILIGIAAAVAAGPPSE